MISLLIVSAMLCLSLGGWDLPSYDFNILVIVPTGDTAASTSTTETQSPPKQSWQQSEELLAAVELARRSLSQLCLPFNLSVRELRTDCTSADLQIVRELIEADRRIIIAVVGYFCKKVSRVLRITSPDRLGLVQIALNARADVDKNNNWQYYHMLPSTRAYAEVLAQFMTHVGWTRIAVASTQTPNSYSFEIAEQVIQVLKNKGFDQSVSVQISDDGVPAHGKHTLVNAIRQIHFSGIKIVYILLPPLETTQLICCAYDYGLRWPDYGWIVPDVSLEDVLSLNSSGNCDPNAGEGILSFRMTNVANHTVSSVKGYNCSEDYHQSSPTIKGELNSNVYANALYNGILATGLSLNQTFQKVQTFLSSSTIMQSSKLSIQKRVSQMVGHKFVNLSFEGTLGRILFSKPEQTHVSEIHNIAIFQNINTSLVRLALYNTHTRRTEFENSSVSFVPIDKLSRFHILIPTPMGVVLMTGLVLCTLLTLFNMSLYIYYRNTPEMKATSVGLSMIIYLSCYSIYVGCGISIFRSINKVADHEREAVCIATLWTNQPSADIILATLIVKVCRIHHIFTHFGKIKRFCSDNTLFLLIILIGLVKVIFIAVWTAVDPFMMRDIETYHPEVKPPYYSVVQQCHSRDSYIWISISLIYTAALEGALALLAFKTRKIKRRDFKDTKKINAFIVNSFVAITFIIPLWGILRLTGNANMSRILLSFLFLQIPMSCQVCLFCPKTIPLLKRSLWKHIFKQPYRIRSHTLEKILFLKQRSFF